MADPRVEAVARVLVDYCAEVEPGQLVQLTGSPEGAPLVLAVYQEVLERGAHPWLRVGLEAVDKLLYTYAGDARLDYMPPFVKEVIDEIDADTGIWTEVNTNWLTNADPDKRCRRGLAVGPLSQRFLEWAAKEEVLWTVVLHPTESAAQDAGMSLREFEDFVYKASLVQETDPIKAWRAISEEHQRAVDWLSRAREIRVLGLETDLNLEVAGRRWRNCDGHENFPDGEIFTGPIEQSINGQIRYTFPACAHGREVEDVRLEFKNGRVVKATAAKEEQFLLQMLDTDEGARYVGEFAFGTNPGIQRFTNNLCFDEKIRGTIHLALGRGLPGTGSKNSSAIHWDMVCDLRKGGEVWVDGSLFLKDGRILV